MTDPIQPPVPPAPQNLPAPGGYPGFEQPGQTTPGYPATPGYQAPPGAYGVPVGGYSAPAGMYSVPPTAPPASRALGVVALILALVAALAVPALGGVFGYQIGSLVPAADLADTTSEDLAFLTPARTQVLWTEIAFWSGTALGLLAIALGIVATARRRGRPQGITAIVLSALGPMLFFGAVFVMFGVGAAASFVP